MPSFDFRKNLLPHILIVIGFIVLSLIYCYPALEGKQLLQHDNVSWKAAAHEGMSYHEKTGEPVMWSNSMFGGMPTYTYYVSESNNYIYYLEDLIKSVVPKPAYFFFIAMLAFYILMHVLRVNRWLGVIGAIAYAFASYNPQIIAAGHETKMLSVAYMPAIIAGLFVLYRGKYLQGAALTAIPLALFITNSHWQMAYYLMIMILFMVIGFFVIALREKRLKNFFISSAIAVLVALVSVGPQMQTLLTTMEYTKHTMRGGQSELSAGHDVGKKQGGLDKDYAFSWSLGIGETFCVLVPDLYGGGSEVIGPESKTYETISELSLGNPQQMAQFAGQVCNAVSKYWGPQPFLSGPVYFGAVICFLFVLGLFIVQSPHKWWMAAVSLLAFMMAWGKHLPGFNYFLFDTLPMLNKFRTPTIILTLPQLLFPALAIWALNDAITEKVSRVELWKKVKISVIITAGLCLLFAVAGSTFLSYSAPTDDALRQQIAQAIPDNAVVNKIFDAVKEDRASIAATSGYWSAFYIVIAGVLLWAFATKKLKAQQLVIAMGLLLAVDMIPQANKYLNEENYKDEDEYLAEFKPRGVDEQILKDPDPYYRVLDVTINTNNSAKEAYFHKMVGGYSPAKMEIYQDLIDNQLSGRYNSQVLNMLNTKYVIKPGPNGQVMLDTNTAALGNAWFVNEIKWVNTADEEMQGLNAPTTGDTAASAGSFNASTTAIVRNTYKGKLNGFTPAKDASATVKLTKYGLNNISFRSRNSSEGFAVFSDIWYPDGWKAFIDGKETPIIRTNYVLRGLRVPAGEHNIEFKFEPESFKKGGVMAAISSVLLIGLLLVAVVMAFRNNKNEEAKV